MNYFLDTEFIEDGSTIDLVSIGIIAPDPSGDRVLDRVLYLQNSECNFALASDWVWRNVFPHLLHFDMSGKRSCSRDHQSCDSGLSHKYITKCSPLCAWATRREIREAVLEFCNPEKHGKPEFWGYYADYDWVAFCQLFGKMIDLPKGYPMYCRDIKQLCDQLGNHPLPGRANKDEHHALADAQWNYEAWRDLEAVLWKQKK